MNNFPIEKPFETVHCNVWWPSLLTLILSFYFIIAVDEYSYTLVFIFSSIVFKFYPLFFYSSMKYLLRWHRRKKGLILLCEGDYSMFSTNLHQWKHDQILLLLILLVATWTIYYSSIWAFSFFSLGEYFGDLYLVWLCVQG